MNGSTVSRLDRVTKRIERSRKMGGYLLVASAISYAIHVAFEIAWNSTAIFPVVSITGFCSSIAMVAGRVIESRSLQYDCRDALETIVNADGKDGTWKKHAAKNVKMSVDAATLQLFAMSFCAGILAFLWVTVTAALHFAGDAGCEIYNFFSPILIVFAAPMIAKRSVDKMETKLVKSFIIRTEPFPENIAMSDVEIASRGKPFGSKELLERLDRAIPVLAIVSCVISVVSQLIAGVEPAFVGVSIIFAFSAAFLSMSWVGVKVHALEHGVAAVAKSLLADTTTGGDEKETRIRAEKNRVRKRGNRSAVATVVAMFSFFGWLIAFEGIATINGATGDMTALLFPLTIVCVSATCMVGNFITGKTGARRASIVASGATDVKSLAYRG